VMNQPKFTPYNPMPIIDQAIGVLKLMQVHFDHPTTISKEVASDTVNEVIDRLRLIQPQHVRLAEAYAAVSAQLPKHLTVCVAPAGADGTELVAVILNGTLVEQQVMAHTPQGLVELLRVRNTALAIAEVPAA